ncbi:hypothetical protein OQA88_5610 [Cercophora sp. LCS_1]
MPPKRAKKATPALPPLDGCKLVFSGSLPGYRSHKVLGAKAEALGATVTAAIGTGTTHLVASDDDFQGVSTKVAKAQSLGIHIVSLDWLLRAEQTNTKQPEKDFPPNGSDEDEEGEDDEQGDNEDDTPPAPAARSPSPAPVPTPVPAMNGRATRKRATPATQDDTVTDSGPKSKRSRAGKATNDNENNSGVVSAGDVQETQDVKTAKKADPVVGAGQVAKNKDLVIPLDEGCPYATSKVYIDTAGVIYDASLNQTNASANNNKFYRIQLLVDPSGFHRTWTRWGRVGERGQTAIAGEGSLETAMHGFLKKFKDKSGLPWDMRGGNPKPSKYAFIERNYSADTDDEDEADAKEEKSAKGKKPSNWVAPKCTLHPSVQALMQLIFNQQFFNAAMSDLNYDANKLPLGKLSRATITRGFQALKDLSALFDDRALAGTLYGKVYERAVEDLSNSFYSIIPHAFGRSRPPIIQSQPMLKKEIELLESLSDMKDTALLMKLQNVEDDDVHPLDRQYQGLNLDEMTPLDPHSTEYAHLADYLVKTRGATHSVNYAIESIFRIERQGEKARFDSAYAKNAKNRRLLWHGSRSTNFGGILSQGLRIAPPEAPVSGYMFGKGIYLADMSSKSANYCCSSQSNNTGLLLLCEAELGDPMQELVNASYHAGEDAKKKGMLSTWGQGRTGPTVWKDAGCVHPSLNGVKMPDTTNAPGYTGVANASLYYNEYITYDVAQVRLRYLFRVRM